MATAPVEDGPEIRLNRSSASRPQSSPAMARSWAPSLWRDRMTDIIPADDVKSP